MAPQQGKEKLYRTGSNIPQKDRGAASDVVSVDLNTVSDKLRSRGGMPNEECPTA